MNLLLERAYFEEGTNGALFYSVETLGQTQPRFLCYTLELPWRNNQRNISCIPEGVYEVIPRFSKKFKHHLLVKDVENRSYILFHPANDALKELRGCIAPVTYLTGIGKGIYSKKALQQLLSLVYQARDRKETILLTVKSVNYESCRTL